MEDILLALLGGGVAVTIIEGIKEAIAWRRNRKALQEDRAAENEEKKTEEKIFNLESDVSEIKALKSALMKNQKSILFDRIQYLCRRYIIRRII